MGSERMATNNKELKEFLIVLRRAMLVLCIWIEKRYQLGQTKDRIT